LATAAARLAPVFVAVATMAVLGAWGLARDSSMGNDEVATRWAALLSLRELAHLVNTVDAVHGLYYLIMHGWVAVGTSPAAMRVPSVIAMCVGVGLVVVIARRLTGSGWAGLVAGLVAALTPSISYYGQTARSYALVYACVAGATLALLHAMAAEAPGAAGVRVTRRWLVYSALVTLGGYLNEMSLLVLAAHAVTVLMARYGQRALRHWIAAAACGAVLVAPLALVSVREHAAVAWISRPNLAALKLLFHDYFGVTTAVALLILACAVIAVPPRPEYRRRTGRAAGGTGSRPEPTWWRHGGISLQSAALPWLVLPAGILLLESVVLHPLYVDRYVLYGEAGAALLAGGGAYRLGRWLSQAANRQVLAAAPGIIVCLCALLLQLGPQHYVRTPRSRAYDFGGPARYVGAHAQPGDGVLFFGTFFRKARLGYPGDFRKVSDLAMAVSPAAAGNFRGRDKPFAATRPLMLAHRRIWVIGRRPSAKLASLPLRAESRVLESGYALIAVRHFRGIVVTLWLRR
jgi:mannosyltransferase